MMWKIATLLAAVSAFFAANDDLPSLTRAIATAATVWFCLCAVLIEIRNVRRVIQGLPPHD